MARTTSFVRGSILLSTLLFVTAIAAVSYSLLALAMTNYRLSQRNEYLARARAVAESELDYVYFHWQSVMMQGAVIGTSTNPTAFTALQDICVLPTQLYTATPVSPFCRAFQNTPEQWVVTRSINCDIPPTPSTDASNKTSYFSYFTAQVIVTTNTPLPMVGPIVVRMGRRMNVQRNPIFQYNVFSQGNLEFAPGGTVTLNGDIAANGSVYLGTTITHNPDGTTTHGTLDVNAYVHYLSIGTAGTGNPTYTDPSTGNLYGYFTGNLENGNSIFTPTGNLSGALLGAFDPTTGLPIIDPVKDPKGQIQAMRTPINLIGGLDAQSIVAEYGNPTNTESTYLFGAVNVDGAGQLIKDTALANDENLAYRAVIAPPPDAVAQYTANSNDAANAFKAEYPAVGSLGALASVTDDSNIAALRAYNQAGLILVISPNSDGTLTQTWLQRTAAYQTLTPVSGGFSGVVTQTSTYDLREGNQNTVGVAPSTPNTVQVTEIDISKLTSALPSTFNGLLYVYLANSDPPNNYGSTGNPVPTRQLAAVRLVNGAKTPVSVDSQGNVLGFTVATNGGLYVKGDYNSVLIDGHTAVAADGSNADQLNPAMLMADAVTILSSTWADSTVTPIPNSDGTYSAAQMAKTNVGPSSSIDIPANLRADGSSGGTTTVGAGILTGSITHDNSAGTYTGTPNNYIYSGGGQNLIRYLEDWSQSSVNIIGSIGRLFESTQYTTPFFSPGGSGNPNLNFPGVYQVPLQRTFTFNSDLQKKSPPGTPQSPVYSRGTLFTW